MAMFLIVLAIIVAGIGFLLLSQATQGVGIVGIACLLGILARIAQASQQHGQLMAKLDLQHDEIKILLQGVEQSQPKEQIAPVDRQPS